MPVACSSRSRMHLRKVGIAISAISGLMGCLAVMTPHMLAVPEKSSESSAYWSFSRARGHLRIQIPGCHVPAVRVRANRRQELGRIIKAHTLQRELLEE